MKFSIITFLLLCVSLVWADPPVDTCVGKGKGKGLGKGKGTRSPGKGTKSPGKGKGYSEGECDCSSGKGKGKGNGKGKMRTRSPGKGTKSPGKGKGKGYGNNCCCETAAPSQAPDLPDLPDETETEPESTSTSVTTTTTTTTTSTTPASSTSTDTPDETPEPTTPESSTSSTSTSTTTTSSTTSSTSTSSTSTSTSTTPTTTSTSTSTSTSTTPTTTTSTSTDIGDEPQCPEAVVGTATNLGSVGGPNGVQPPDYNGAIPTDGGLCKSGIGYRCEGFLLKNNCDATAGGNSLENELYNPEWFDIAGGDQLFCQMSSTDGNIDGDLICMEVNAVVTQEKECEEEDEEECASEVELIGFTLTVGCTSINSAALSTCTAALSSPAYGFSDLNMKNKNNNFYEWFDGEDNTISSTNDFLTFYDTQKNKYQELSHTSVCFGKCPEEERRLALRANHHK